MRYTKILGIDRLAFWTSYVGTRIYIDHPLYVRVDPRNLFISCHRYSSQILYELLGTKQYTEAVVVEDKLLEKATKQGGLICC